MKTKVPAPLALKHLIESNNQLLQKYQKELTDRVLIANEEMMRILGLDPNDGWKLDIDTFSYVKMEQDDSTSVS